MSREHRARKWRGRKKRNLRNLLLVSHYNDTQHHCHRLVKSLRISFIFIVKKLMTHLYKCMYACGSVLCVWVCVSVTYKMAANEIQRVCQRYEILWTMATALIEEWQRETTNRYESHYISRDFIMCVAMIKCIVATIHSVVLCCDGLYCKILLFPIIFSFFFFIYLFILYLSRIFFLPFTRCV